MNNCGISALRLLSTLLLFLLCLMNVFPEGQPDTGISEVYDVAVTLDNHIFAAGYFRTRAKDNAKPYIWCYTESGVLDRSVNRTGFIDLSNYLKDFKRMSNGTCGKILIDDRGTIFVAGNYDEKYNFLFRIPLPYSEPIDILQNTESRDISPEYYNIHYTDLLLDKVGYLHYLQLSGLEKPSIYLSARSSLNSTLEEISFIADCKADSETYPAASAVGEDGHLYFVYNTSLDESVKEGSIIILCLDQSGRLEEEFNNSGIFKLPNAGVCRTMSVDNKGRVLLGGDFEAWHAALWRLLPDGRVDSDFGINGFRPIPLPSETTERQYTWTRDIALDKENNIYVLITSGAFEYELEVWKLDEMGQVIESYGENGYARAFGTAGGNRDYGLSIAADSQGRVIVGGSSKTDYHVSNEYGGTHGRIMTLWRFNQEGQPDITFGDGGHVLIHTKPLE